MDINVEHPSFIKFLDNSTKAINEKIDISNYIDIDEKRKSGVEFIVYQTFINSFSFKVKLTEEERVKVLDTLMLHNAKNENYILSLILKNIKTNSKKYEDLKNKKKSLNLKPIKPVN